MLDATGMLAILLLCALAIAAWRDLQVREIPDLLSLGLVVVGVLGAIAIAIVERNPSVLYASATGALAGFGAGWLLYRARQWGGGDVKLLAGVGAILGLWAPDYRLLAHIILLAFAGTVWGLTYSAWLVWRHRVVFRRAFTARIREPAIHRARTALVGCGIAGLLALLVTPLWAQLAILCALCGAYLLFYTWIVSRTLENAVLTRSLPVARLMEGDWIIRDVRKKDGKVLVPARKTGVSADDIAALRRAKIKTVMVREGIPFVPAFLLATLLLFALENQFPGALGLLLG